MALSAFPGGEAAPLRGGWAEVGSPLTKGLGYSGAAAGGHGGVLAVRAAAPRPVCTCSPPLAGVAQPGWCSWRTSVPSRWPVAEQRVDMTPVIGPRLSFP